MKLKVPVLETSRLLLKKGNYDDFSHVYEYDFTRLKNIEGEFIFVKNKPEDIKLFSDYSECDGVLDFIVFLKDNDEAIGNITFDRYNPNFNSVQLEVNLHPKYWRCGYMTEALLCVIDYIYKNTDINNIFYGYAEGNYKSSGLCEKLGFKYYNSYLEYYDRFDTDILKTLTVLSRNHFYNNFHEKKYIRMKERA